MAKKKKMLELGGTTFKVDNLDHLFLMEALDSYKETVEFMVFPARTVVTKSFVLDRVNSLIETFKIKD